MHAPQEFHDSTLYLIRAETAVSIGFQGFGNSIVSYLAIEAAVAIPPTSPANAVTILLALSFSSETRM